MYYMINYLSPSAYDLKHGIDEKSKYQICYDRQPHNKVDVFHSIVK